jgi:hypothetical protein
LWKKVDELHQLRAELAMTAALVASKAQERRRRSVTRRGGEAYPFTTYSRGHATNAGAAVHCSRGTEDWWTLLARFSAPLEKTQMATAGQ